MFIVIDLLWVIFQYSYSSVYVFISMQHCPAFRYLNLLDIKAIPFLASGVIVTYLQFIVVLLVVGGHILSVFVSTSITPTFWLSKYCFNYISYCISLEWMEKDCVWGRIWWLNCFWISYASKQAYSYPSLL